MQEAERNDDESDDDGAAIPDRTEKITWDVSMDFRYRKREAKDVQFRKGLRTFDHIFFFFFSRNFYDRMFTGSVSIILYLRGAVSVSSCS